MDQLQIIGPEGQVLHYPLVNKGGYSRIGSNPANEIVLADPTLPLFAACLHHQNRPYQLEWLRAATPPQPLHHLSQFTLGAYQFTLLHAQAEPQLVEESPFSIRNFAPKRQQLSRFSPHSFSRLTITNHSDRAATFRLQLLESPQYYTVELFPPHETVGFGNLIEFRLAGQETATLPIRLSAAPRPPLGWHNRREYYTLQLSLLNGELARTLQGEISQSPLIGPWLCTMGLLLGGCILGLIILHQSGFNSPPTPALSVEQPQTRPTIPRPAWVDNPLPETQPNLPASEPLTLTEIFQEIGPLYGLDWRILAATAQVESGLNPHAMGRDGDAGLMQIIPNTWLEWAPKASVSLEQRFDPYNNVKVGAAYMAYLRRYCAERGLVEARWMLVAYNWGPHNINKLAQAGQGWFDVPLKQRNYANRILNRANMLSYSSIGQSKMTTER